MTVIAEGSDFPSAGCIHYTYDEQGRPVRQAGPQGVVSKYRGLSPTHVIIDEGVDWSDVDTYSVARVEALEALARLAVAELSFRKDGHPDIAPVLAAAQKALDTR